MRVLFASLPADGHFNPLTGLAVELRARGHDVRWYAAPSYAGKLDALGIPCVPFARATDLNGENLAHQFPEYEKLGNGPKAIAFALEKIFFGNLEAHYRDICEAHAAFAFDALLFEAGFYAASLVCEKLDVPGYAVWPAPSPAPTSAQTPPPFFGLRPARGPLGRMRDRVARALVESSTKKGMAILHDLRRQEALPPYRGSVFDLHVGVARALFQVGTPGMEFPRTDWPAHHRFVGALVPHRKPATALPGPVQDKLARYRSVVVVSQGTIDNRDDGKLFVPALQALRGGAHLVIVATGGRHTEALRAKFADDNVLIEDWIDFGLLLPHADVFVTNGGHGSVMQALLAGVPIIAAGRLEGKNDVSARLAYNGLAIDLRTERPSATQIAKSVERILTDDRYERNVARVRAELESYHPFDLIEQQLLEDVRGGGAATPRARTREQTAP